MRAQTGEAALELYKILVVVFLLFIICEPIMSFLITTQ